MHSFLLLSYSLCIFLPRPLFTIHMPSLSSSIPYAPSYRILYPLSTVPSSPLSPKHTSFHSSIHIPSLSSIPYALPFRALLAQSLPGVYHLNTLPSTSLYSEPLIFAPNVNADHRSDNKRVKTRRGERIQGLWTEPASAYGASLIMSLIGWIFHQDGKAQPMSD